MSAVHGLMQLVCPQCQARVAAADTVCPACQADLALAAAVAEQQLLQSTPGTVSDPPRPVHPEQLVPRLGEYLRAQGHISDAQLRQALGRQAQPAGGARLTGQILVEMGAITQETLDRVLARRIAELQSALVSANRSLEQRVADRTAELEAALLRLTELNQLKANLVANVSHELRTPLNQIQGYASLLSDGALGGLEARQMDALDVIQTAVARLEHMVDNLIRYAAIARGELTLARQRLPAGPLAEAAVGRCQAMADRKGVGLELRSAPDLSDVYADGDQLRWALMQLLDNAIKFTPAGGHVVLSAAVDGQRVCWNVQDTGIGIAPEQLGELFQDFRQLDGSTARRYGGAGLGLAMVRRIVQAHGGTVRVESQAGGGSRFTLELPLAGPPPAQGGHA